MTVVIPVLEITFDNRPISGTSGQVSICLEEMSGQKRASTDYGCGSLKKRAVTKIVEKWISENDQSLHTIRCLRFVGDREYVTKLKCDVCRKFNDKLMTMRNYRSAFIEGTANVRASTFTDHAATEMHQRAMSLEAREKGASVMEYAPIARAMPDANLSEAAKVKIKKKMDIAYMIAKENLAFTKMEAICKLEERHGTALGSGYKNDHSCAMFIECIAQEQIEKLVSTISNRCFFSLQADGTTDAGNTVNELFMILYLDKCSRWPSAC